MANLALKAVMWGADKIPDSVFESLPGNYFKPPKDGNDHRRRQSDYDKRRRDSKRYSDDEDYGSRPRRHDSHRHHHHRHNNDDDSRRHSEGHRRHRSRPSRGSYDDGDDDLSDAPPRRRRSESHHRRRNSHDDDNDDRYGYTNGYDGRHRPEDRHSDDAPNRPPYPVSNGEPRRHDRDTFAPGGKATAAAAAAGAAAATASRSHDVPQSPPPESVRSNGFEHGYVPYSNIYGQPTQQPSSRSIGVDHDQHTSPIARPPYPQNPRAQESALGAQPNYIAPDDDYDPRYDPHYYDPPAHDDRDSEYASRPESTYEPSRSRSRRGRDYSPSYASYDSRYDDEDRRAQSERRTSDRKTARSKSKVREAFDPSQRGIGYGAVGALAGGLVGSEIGKGPIPAVIGAVIGGAGANAFQARERRKEAKRHEQYTRDGVYDRRNARAIKMDAGGYRSD